MKHKINPQAYEAQIREYAKSENIPYEQAKSEIDAAIMELEQPELESKQKKKEPAGVESFASSRRPMEKDNFFSKLGDYAVETVKHPLDRAGQIAASALSVLPGVADFATTAAALVPGLGIEPTRYGQRVHEDITKFNKNVLGLNPAESRTAEGLNEIPGSVLGMPILKTAGKGLQKAGDIIRGGTNVKGLKTAGKVAEKAIGGTGRFLEGGSNIKNPVDVAATAGATAAPNIIDEEDRSLGSNLILSYLGGKTGANTARRFMHKYSPKSKEYKQSREYENIISPEQENINRYEELGVPSHTFNAVDFKPVKLLAKKADTSLFGQDVNKALSEQKEAISGRITPLHNQEVSQSDIGKMLKEPFETHTQSIKDEFATKFDRLYDLVEENTSSNVPLKNVSGFLQSKIKRLSPNPVDIKHFLVSRAGQMFQDLMRPVVEMELNKHANNANKLSKAGAKNVSGKDLELKALQDQISKGLKKETVTVNGVPVDIDPLLASVLANKELKKQLLSPQQIASIDYVFANNSLRRMGDAFEGNHISPYDVADVKELYGSLKKDIMDSVGEELKHSNPRGFNEMMNTLNEYTEFSKGTKHDINSLMKDINNPIKFAQNIGRDLKSGGNKGKLIIEGLDPKQRKEFIDHTNRVLGSPRENPGRDFNPLVWSRNFQDLDAMTKRNLYGDKVQYFDKVSKVVDDIGKVHGFANTSQSGVHVQSSAEIVGLMSVMKSIGSDLIKGNVGNAIGTLLPSLAGTVGINKLLTSEPAKRAYLKLKNAQSKREALDAINGIEKYTTNKALRAVFKNFGALVRMAK